MADYNEKTVQELKDEAKARGLQGYSDKNKEELVALLEESDQGDGSSESDSAAGPVNDEDQTGDSPEEVEPYLPSVVEDEDQRQRLAEDHAMVEHHTAASDPDNDEVVDALSPEGQEALDKMTEAEKFEADLALDASGPLKLQDPSERVQGGSVNEKHAKELEEKFGDLPEDFVGNLREDGFVPGRDDEKREGSGPNGEIVQEDVIDFPPPLAELEKEKEELTSHQKESSVNGPYVQHEAAKEAFPDEGETVAKDRLFNQRGQLYTDGLSGQADHNTVLAYRVNDLRAQSEDEDSEERDQYREDENKPRESDDE